MAQEFETVFTDILTNGGYELVDEAAEDVLLIRPSIVNLDITAPNQHGSGRSSSYTRSAGEMTYARNQHKTARRHRRDPNFARPSSQPFAVDPSNKGHRD